MGTAPFTVDDVPLEQKPKTGQRPADRNVLLDVAMTSQLGSHDYSRQPEWVVSRCVWRTACVHDDL